MEISGGDCGRALPKVNEVWTSFKRERIGFYLHADHFGHEEASSPIDLTEIITKKNANEVDQ